MKLVGARACPADSVLRRSNEGSARRAARTHLERARHSLTRSVTVSSLHHRLVGQVSKPIYDGAVEPSESGEYLLLG